METHELFTQEQLNETLAKNVTHAYQRPGQQGQRGHGAWVAGDEFGRPGASERVDRDPVRRPHD